jgi:D-serine dehydratase
MAESIHGRKLRQWCARHPELETVIAARPLLWINPDYADEGRNPPAGGLSSADIDDARARLQRFASYIAKVFPDTRADGGLIESPLRAVPGLQQRLEAVFEWNIPGRLLLKCDNELAISGSIKARGGIYEVLKYAETLALEHGLISIEDDYSRFDGDEFKRLFANYSIAVGSTGNLGLSIGIISARLGLPVTVHMSADARRWKKDLLRHKGVEVIEYEADYGEAVRQGRAQAAADPAMHFIDDENSIDLFTGYAVAATRLQQQLRALDIEIGADRPLFVYLPCGVGGGPGGITFGLKQVFGGQVHCFFAEPVASPCMLLGMMTGLHEQVDVRDFGLDNVTESDGLAVASPSAFVGRLLQHDISGIFTIQDDMQFRLLSAVRDSEGIALEPSATAGLTGPAMLVQSQAGQDYLRAHNLLGSMPAAIHVVWATGGGMVPEAEMNAYYQKGMFACG